MNAKDFTQKRLHLLSLQHLHCISNPIVDFEVRDWLFRKQANYIPIVLVFNGHEELDSLELRPYLQAKGTVYKIDCLLGRVKCKKENQLECI